MHAAFDKIRDELVPVNKKWPISKLFKELEVYNSSERKKRITFEYIMLDGVNDSLKDAKQLIKLIRPLKSKVNLIPFNPWPDSSYSVSSPEKIINLKNLFWKMEKL